MSERTLVDYVLRGLAPYWRCPVKHADAFTAGVPDVSGHLPGVGTRWIELKANRNWPARAATPVRLACYTEEQKRFLIERKGVLLLRVGREYLLFVRPRALKLLGTVSREQTRQIAAARWTGKIPWDDLVAILRGLSV